ncbi:hypothetical protein AB0B66_13830 [Catellatospora sp. NPDC049111]|uniref:hypothetical protein n=1 Tax=Catellatospora sp. NPDC049111 TaxID=3155271 RepID=UPI0033FC90EA
MPATTWPSTVTGLAELGVRRVSLGSLLFRLALGAAVDAAVHLRANGVLPQLPSVPGYAVVPALASSEN